MELHLAAMENVSCWAFRKLCQGASDSYTGMLSLGNLINRNNTWKEVDTYNIEGQRQWIQIITSKERDCTAFLAKLKEELKTEKDKDNIYGIQLNASCPSKDVIRVGQGPALIKRATKVSNILKELLKQDKYKVGIKVRLGLNEMEVRQRKVVSLFETLESLKDPNLTRVSVHFKHAQQKSAEGYDYSMLKELASFNLPIVINGGISNSSDVKKILASIDSSHRKNIVGIMLGREAMKNPDCFVELNKNLNDVSLKPRTISEIKEEFNSLCKQHAPQSIYLEKMKYACPWFEKR